MNLEIRDTAVTRDPNGNGYIQAKTLKSGRTSYRVTVELVGDDIPFVESVTYVLHRTFKNNIKKVNRTLSNQNCSLSFYAWGTFTIYAEVETVSGEVIRISHNLRFDQDIINGEYPIKS